MSIVPAPLRAPAPANRLPAPLAPIISPIGPALASLAVVLLVSLALPEVGFAQEPSPGTPVEPPGTRVVTPHTRALADDAATPVASLDAAAFLVGAWRAEALGGVAEEFWAPPAGGAMVGMFRLLRDDAPAFYEIFTLTEEPIPGRPGETTLILRLKHFGPDLAGWEERTETVDFPLVHAETGRLWLEGLTFEAIDPDTLRVHLAIEGKDGVREEIFEFRRIHMVGPTGPGKTTPDDPAIH